MKASECLNCDVNLPLDHDSDFCSEECEDDYNLSLDDYDEDDDLDFEEEPLDDDRCDWCGDSECYGECIDDDLYPDEDDDETGPA